MTSVIGRPSTVAFGAAGAPASPRRPCDELAARCAARRRRADSVQIATIDRRIRCALEGPPPAPDPEAHRSSGEPRGAGGVLADARRDQLRLRLVPDAAQASRAGPGYFTIAIGVRRRFDGGRPVERRELAALDAAEIARVLGQDPDHELMELYRPVAPRPRAPRLETADGGWFARRRRRRGRLRRRAGQGARRRGRASPTAPPTTSSTIPFLKRAQIAAADLAHARASPFGDLDELTMFADNLVPHVLRLDGVLGFDPELVGTDRAPRS